MSQSVQLVRNPPPRPLALQETLYSLNHWRTNFRTYYRRDSYFKCFLLPNAQWDPTAEHYGQRPERSEGVITRSAEDKSEDLKDFLNTLIGYLPFPYLTEKILNATKNLQEVWDIIFEHYGIKVFSESLLDFPAMALTEGEQDNFLATTLWVHQPIGFSYKPIGFLYLRLKTLEFYRNK